ncbi:MAG TPA: VOC family protein [Candidatus Baltobacteraceae bacterium]|jgi:predicted enzyme related to lactoylglutathione lyase
MPAVQTIAAKGIDSIHVLVKDLDRARTFYTDVIGLKVATTYPSGCEFELADGSTFGISYMKDTFFPGGGMLFAVDDVAEAVSALKAAGVQLFTEVQESPVCHIAWAADTEGNYFAVHKRKN